MTTYAQAIQHNLMTEQEARDLISKAQDALETFGFKTYLMEVHVPTVMEQMSVEGTNEDKQDAIEDAWYSLTNSWCMDANNIAEQADGEMPEPDEDE
jgi:hypothetical protein